MPFLQVTVSWSLWRSARDPVFEAALARVARPPVPEAWFARFASGPPVPVAEVAAASGLAGTAGVVGVAESVEPAVEHVSWDPYLDDSDELQGGEDEVELLEACRRFREEDRVGLDLEILRPAYRRTKRCRCAAAPPFLKLLHVPSLALIGRCFLLGNGQVGGGVLRGSISLSFLFFGAFSGCVVFSRE